MHQKGTVFIRALPFSYLTQEGNNSTKVEITFLMLFQVNSALKRLRGKSAIAQQPIRRQQHGIFIYLQHCRCQMKPLLLQSPISPP